MGVLDGLFSSLAPALGGAIPSLVSGVFGVLGAKQTRKDAQSDAANKFVDLRNAAIAGGFNPLTALEATGGSGFGNYPSSAPPLASIELLKGALDAGAAELNGSAENQRKADRLNLDLAQIKVDQAKASAKFAPPVSATGAGSPGGLGYSAAKVPGPGDVPAMNKANKYDLVWDPDTKTWFKYPNPNYTDSSPSEMATGLAMQGAANVVQNPGLLPGISNGPPIVKSVLPPQKSFPAHPGQTSDAWWKKLRADGAFSLF